MHRPTASLFASAVLSALVFLAAPAAAQTSAEQPSEEAQAEARERFGRGLELYNEGQFQAALAEFQRAYDIAPAYQVLYNLGKVYAQLGNAVRSADAFEQYLREGGEAIAADRREEVEADLERQRARIARVMVRTNVDGATVIVDGADVATTPLDEPLRVTAGEHVIGARAPRHDTAQRRVQLAGGVRETLELELHEVAEERGALRVRTGVPGVEIRVDGEVVGTTPLDGTVAVAPGSHQVEGRREGYVTAGRQVEVDNAAETAVALEMRVDPQARPEELGRLRLRVPNASFTLTVDGREVDAAGGSLELPVGEHDVLLDVAEREPVRATLEVPSQAGVDFDPVLEWTPSARDERLSDARTLRTWGTVLAIGGAVLTAVGGPAFVYFAKEREDLRAEFDRLDEEKTSDECRADPSCAERIDGRQLEIRDDELPTAFNLRNAAGAVAAVGLAALGTGIVMLVLAPSDESIEEEARAAAEPRLRLRAGLGGLSLEGSF